MGIYVEIDLATSLDDVWHLTQEPVLHQPWDLRFTGIEYLPRPDERQPQRFAYSTRIGLGLAIRGMGETVATRADAQGCRTSSLRFWSDDKKSLIREGRGYWQYQRRVSDSRNEEEPALLEGIEALTTPGAEQGGQRHLGRRPRR